MDPIKFRMRYVIGFLIAAVVTAAALRHFLHVQVGFSREEIRNGVLLIAAIGIFLLIAFFRWRRPP
jgi:heme/copper-type cytochrome/quinol oxidase subunit 4